MTKKVDRCGHMLKVKLRAALTVLESFKIFLGRGSCRGPDGVAYDAPRSRSRLKRGYSLPILYPVDAFRLTNLIISVSTTFGPRLRPCRCTICNCSNRHSFPTVFRCRLTGRCVCWNKTNCKSENACHLFKVTSGKYVCRPQVGTKNNSVLGSCEPKRRQLFHKVV